MPMVILGVVTKAESSSQKLEYCVIVPARNEADNISACLDAIFRQTILPREVVVVDGMSEDETVNIVQSHNSSDSTQIVQNPNRTIPHALNAGLAATAAPIIVRVDGHTIIADNYVEQLIHHFNDPTIGGVGPAKFAVASSKWGEALAQVVNSPFGGIASYHYSESVSDVDHVPYGVYRRSVVESLGGWDTRCLVNQDFEFDFRVRRSGLRLLLVPDARVDWRCSESLRDTWHQYHRYGKGKALVAKIHPSSVSLKQALGTTLFPGFIALLLPGP